MKWHYLNSEEDLSHIKEASYEMPQLIFKHSTACGISAAARRNMETFFNGYDAECAVWEVYVVENRDISQSIAYHFDLPHKSPQVLVVYNGQLQWHTSHVRITRNRLVKALEALN